VEGREKMERLIENVCREKGIDRQELSLGGRSGRFSEVRTELAWLLVYQLGVSLAETARQIGVSTSAISQALKRREESRQQ
jgi:predicted HTH domain antitoxin